MTLTKRAPALLLTLLTVGLAALVVALTTSGGSDAAPTRPAAATAARPATAPITSKPATARPTTAKPTTAKPTGTAVEPGDPHAGDTAGQMYLTDTDERRGQLIHAYYSCLLGHGATQETSTAAAPVAAPYQGRGREVLVLARPYPATAVSACADREPLLPKQETPSLNPDYAADSQANVDCIRAHGVAVHTVADDSVFPDGLSWTYDNDHVVTPDDEAQLEQACLIQAFGD